MYPIRTMARVLKFRPRRLRLAEPTSFGSGDRGRRSDASHPHDPRWITWNLWRAACSRRAKADGLSVGRKRIARLMRAAGIAGVSRREARRSRRGRRGTIIPPAISSAATSWPSGRTSRGWPTSACRSKRRERWGQVPAIGLQEQVANHRKRRWSKRGRERYGKALQRRQVGDRKANTVNRRSSVESAQTTSKPVSDVAPGSAWTRPLTVQTVSGIGQRDPVSGLR